MILITSAAYCGEDLKNEIGNIPASFLPINNQRLYELQAALFATATDDKFISLPENFEVHGFDRIKLEKLGLEIIRVKESITLGESIFRCLEKMKGITSLQLLHGDTLFSRLPEIDGDVYTISETDFEYDWGLVQTNGVSPSKTPISGYFKFTNPNALSRALKDSAFQFLEALKIYQQNENVTLVQAEDWFDFGHRNSMFKFKKQHLATRHFNQIEPDTHTISKRSRNIGKIKNEYSWYSNLPPYLSLFAPRLASPLEIENGEASYSLEIIPSFNLAEIFVYGNKDMKFWQKVLRQLGGLLQAFLDFGPQSIGVPVSGSELNTINQSLYLDKTQQRLRQYASQNNTNIESLLQLAKESATRIPPTQYQHLAYAHGDFCLSNILLNTHADRPYLVDPKGINSELGKFSFSDIRYDIAKLFHSLFGGYDFIVADRFCVRGGQLRFDKKDLAFMHNFYEPFLELVCPDGVQIEMEEILAINVQLFLSMVPLHKENSERQKAFLKNAERLHLL